MINSYRVLTIGQRHDSDFSFGFHPLLKKCLKGNVGIWVSLSSPHGLSQQDHMTVPSWEVTSTSAL